MIFNQFRQCEKKIINRYKKHLGYSPEYWSMNGLKKRKAIFYISKRNVAIDGKSLKTKSHSAGFSHTSERKEINVTFTKEELCLLT